VVALSTLGWVKSTATAPLVIVMALFRLKSSVRPVCWPEVRVNGNGAVVRVIIPEVVGLNSQVVAGLAGLTGQGAGVPPVRAKPV